MTDRTKIRSAATDSIESLVSKLCGNSIDMGCRRYIFSVPAQIPNWMNLSDPEALAGKYLWPIGKIESQEDTVLLLDLDGSVHSWFDYGDESFCDQIFENLGALVSKCLLAGPRKVFTVTDLSVWEEL